MILLKVDRSSTVSQLNVWKECFSLVSMQVLRFIIEIAFSLYYHNNYLQLHIKKKTIVPLHGVMICLIMRHLKILNINTKPTITFINKSGAEQMTINKYLSRILTQYLIQKLLVKRASNTSI